MFLLAHGLMRWTLYIKFDIIDNKLLTSEIFVSFVVCRNAQVIELWQYMYHNGCAKYYRLIMEYYHMPFYCQITKTGKTFCTYIAFD